MTPDTIQKLNSLNQNFYHQVAQHFSDTRDSAWPGWQQILTALEEKHPSNLKVLDLGCGNGRFGSFLAETLPRTELDYTGVDFSDELLAIARQNLEAKIKPLQLIKADIVTAMLDGGNLTKNEEKYDLIVAFGLLHHLPSAKLRSDFVAMWANHLHSGGMLVITAWQFMNSPRQRQKVVEPTLAGIDEELEPNDYIMSWDGDTVAYRYAHHFDDIEINALLPQEGFVAKTFNADGKEGNLNKYLVITRA